MGWCEDGTMFQGTPIREVRARAVGSAVNGDGRGCPCCGHFRLSEVRPSAIRRSLDITVCLGCGVAFRTLTTSEFAVIATRLRARADDGETLSRASQQFLDKFDMGEFKEVA